jgi:Mg-chelatase subunit ChlD
MDMEKLKNRDYVLIIDKSGSMEERDCPGGKSRWESLQESTMAIAVRCNEYDPDGITVIPFAGSFKVYDNTTPAKVKELFLENSPMGGTDLTPPLEWAFENYLKLKVKNQQKANGMLCIVITDGCPQDEDMVAKSIVRFTKKLDNREEFGISLIQVGKDEHARSYLKRLDTHLEDEGSKLDIVNTKTMDELETVGLTEALIAALTD